MATLQKKGRLYYAVFYDPARQPKRKYVPLRTANKRAATAALAALEVEYAKGKYDPWDPQPPSQEIERLGEAADAFYRTKGDLSRSTQRMYRFVVNGFVDSAGRDLRLAAVRSSHVRTFLEGRALNDTSTATYFRHLRVFVRWMLKEKLISENPLEDIEPPRKPQKLPKSVTEDELQAVCIAVVMGYQAKRETGFTQEGDLIWRIPLMLFAFCTGMRASELARLKWEHIDFEKRLIYILKQKNGKEGTIPLNMRAQSILGGIEKGLPGDYVFSPPNVGSVERTVSPFVGRASRAFREARNRAGINRSISFHGLRHGFCTALAEAGKSAFVIQAAARHADISTSARYVHIANTALRAELDNVFG